MLRLAAFLLFAALVLPFPAPAESMIRIAVVETRGAIRISGEGLRLRPLRDDGYYAAVAGSAVELERDGDSVQAGGVDTGAGAVKLRADGPITIGDKQVRGSVEVLVHADGLVVVNELPMETYLAAVLGSEMPPSFAPEALKAQAVAARTYAIGKKLAMEGQPWHLGATVLSQVYGGVHREDPRTAEAVRATEGEVLVYEHAPIEAYFFSSCGGGTAGGGEALGRPLPYLTAHPCPESGSTPGASWRLELSAAELGKRLGVGKVDSIRIDTRTASGRARSVEVRSAKGTRRFTGADLRQRVGYAALKSLSFEVSKHGKTFRFDGEGSGHGAGLCQWGAQAAALDGWDYRRILGLYYPGAELRRMY